MAYRLGVSGSLDAALSARTSLVTGALLGWALLALATAAGARWAAGRSERVGRLLDRAVGILAPGLAGRVLRAAVGLGAAGTGLLASGLLQPVAATAAPVAPTATTATTATSSAVPAASHGRPSPAVPGGRQGPDDLWPLSTPARSGVVNPGAAAPLREVVVHRGDTLWSIAARQLPPHTDNSRINALWHRWYAHNRAVIGADPDLLLPGQVLQAPF